MRTIPSRPPPAGGSRLHRLLLLLHFRNHVLTPLYHFQSHSRPIESLMLNALNYEKIDDTSIRLVFIQVPSQADVGSDGLISCRLTTFPISTCPWYTCLSYAWDEPLATRDGLDSTIEVNGSEISVQPNLYQTLRQWIAAVHRGDLVDHKPTWFWLDAICIDQSNVRERTLQVSIMHRICRDAKWGTVVWLGPDPDAEVYTVRESFRALVQQYYDPEIPMKYPTDFLLHEKVFPGHLPPCDAEIWKVTMRFWDRAWFGRS